MDNTLLAREIEGIVLYGRPRCCKGKTDLKRRSSLQRLCHKLDCGTDCARRSMLSGSGAGGNASRRESAITTVTMLGS